MEAESGRDRENVRQERVCVTGGKERGRLILNRDVWRPTVYVCVCGGAHVCFGLSIPLCLSNILQLLLDSSPAHPQPATYGPPITK